METGVMGTAAVIMVMVTIIIGRMVVRKTSKI